jgi:hypothetical protein
LRPEDITPLVAAYEDCLRTLTLSDRSDPVTEILAKKIIENAQTGIRGFGPARSAGARGNPNFRPWISAGRQGARRPGRRIGEGVDA